MSFVIALLLIVFGFLYFQNQKKAKRKAELLLKYGDADLVEKILSQSIWAGQTKDELLDAIGKPAEVDSKLMKTRSREIWKYNPSGKNRFGLRVTLDDGRVAGWDKKS
jgi:hypothetical protein